MQTMQKVRRMRFDVAGWMHAQGRKEEAAMMGQANLRASAWTLVGSRGPFG